MKYLQNRNQFINRKIVLESSQMNKQIQNSRLIRETFENDITWGGSLLGRLINSIIRRGKIYYNTARIDSIISKVKVELNYLVQDVTFTQEQKKKLKGLTIKFILEEIYSVVKSEEELDVKCTKLIGSRDDDDDDNGLVNQTLKELEKITDEQFPKRKELIVKLENFRDALRKIDFKSTSGEEEAEEEVLTEKEEEILELCDKFLNNFQKLVQTFELVKFAQTETGSEEQLELKFGENYSYKDVVVQIIDMKNVITGLGGQIKGKLKEGQVCVIYFKNGKPEGEGFAVNKSELSKIDGLGKGDFKGKTEEETKKNDSLKFYYQNEFLPIFEEAEVQKIKNNNTIEISSDKSRNFMKQIKTKDQNLKYCAEKCREILKDYSDNDRLELAKKLIVKLVKESESFMKDVEDKFNNRKKLQDVNEKLNEQDETDFIDKISETSIFLIREFMKTFEGLPTEEETKISEELGLVSDGILSLIEVFGKFREKSEEIQNAQEEENTEVQEESFRFEIKETDFSSKSKIFNFRRFKMFEEYGDDSAIKAWDELFEEGEEEEWRVEKAEAKELQKETEDIGKKPFVVEESSCRDHIIRIVNLFAKAYRLYATDYIPSGRPEGRTSLKTHREYQYIGDATSVPEWEAEGTAGYGPWAAKLTYQKWQDGIMNILEDTEYRKVLANARFLPKNVEELGSGETEVQRGGAEQYPEKVVRAGRSLFDFMNDLLAGEGPFDKIKRKVLAEYFKGADKIDQETEKGLKKGTLVESKTKADKDTAMFQLWNYYGLGRSDAKKIPLIEFAEGKRYENEFIKIVYNDKKESLICYVMGVLKNKGVVIKFNKVKKSTNTFISEYLKDDIESDKLKLDDTVKKTQKNEPLYVGLLWFKDKDSKFDDHIYTDPSNEEKLTFKYCEITGKNVYKKEAMQTFSEEIDLVMTLCVSEDGYKWKAVKLQDPKYFLKKDIESIDKIKGLDFYDKF